MALYEKKKLTVRIDSKVIDKAKKYATEQNTSVSKLIELFLSNLTASSQKETDHSNLVDQLTGVIPEELNVELIREKRIREKYDV